MHYDRTAILTASIVAALAVLVSVTGLAPGLTATAGGKDRFAPAEHPVAVLAWAKANCYPGLALREGAHPTHPEILLEVAGAFETARTWRKIADLCHDALVMAEGVAARDTLPDATGERALFEHPRRAADVASSGDQDRR